MSSVQNFIDHGRVRAELLFKRNFTIPCAQNEKRYEVEVEFRICKYKSESCFRNINLSNITDSFYIALSFIGSVKHIENIGEKVEVSEDCCGGGSLYNSIILGLINEVPNGVSRGYRYGQSWLFEKVPNEVIEEAANLFEGFEVK